MIIIKRSVYNQIITLAQAELPNEACGYLAGNDAIVSKGYSLTNVDKSPEHFSFDPSEQFQTLRDARKNGLQILANYHSHPSSPSRPSVEDIRLAYDSSISYVIISFAAEEPVVKSFRIVDGIVSNEELIIED